MVKFTKSLEIGVNRSEIGVHCFEIDVHCFDLRFAPFGNKQLGSKRSHFLDGFSDLSEPNFG